MPLRALLKYANPDSTRDLNDRTRDIFNKGVFVGGEVTPVTGQMQVRIAPFGAIGADGMIVREDVDSTVLGVQDGVKNYIVLRQVYRDNNQPTVQFEVLTEAAFNADPELDFLILFAVVDVPLLSVTVTQTMIDFRQRDEIDSVSRLSVRGRLSNAGDLPPGSNNDNRPGDLFIVSNGTGDFPELFAWNGAEWKNVTQAQLLLDSLALHRQNAFSNEQHLSDGEKAAAVGTVGAPSTSNRYVTSLDPRLPNQNENDALQGDPSIFSESSPSDSNRFITASKLFALPTSATFNPTGVIEVADGLGPVYVGKGNIGTAQRWFNLIGANPADPEDDDQEYINSQFQSVRITGVFTDASFLNELNPAVHAFVDALGFFSGASLFLKTDNTVDTPYGVLFGKRSKFGDVHPAAFLNRGPQNGQVDSRVVRMLEGNVNPQFPAIFWDVGVIAGNVVGFNPSLNKFVKHDSSNPVLVPLGVRGNANNLIIEGVYEDLSGSPFDDATLYYAHPSISGALTTTPNSRLVGRGIAPNLLLVNMSFIALTEGEAVVGVAYDASFWDASLLPGEVAGWNTGTAKFVRADLSNSLLTPVGVRGNSNNLIQEGKFTVLAGTPYVVGSRYYAHSSTPGALSTTQNDHYIARAITTNSLLVNMNHSPIWELARTVFHIEHLPSGVHEIGSAHTYVGLSGDRFTASGSNAESTGIVLVGTDTGQIWYCTNGALNTWVEISRIDTPFTFGAALTALSTARVNGTLILPSKILSDNAADTTFNPFTHGARHKVAGLDPISGILNQAVSSTTLLATNITTSVQNILETTHNFTGRPSFTTVKIEAAIRFQGSAISTDRRVVIVELLIDGVVQASATQSATLAGATAGAAQQSISTFFIPAPLTAASHTITVRAQLANFGAGTITAQNGVLSVMDFGAGA